MARPKAKQTKLPPISVRFFPDVMKALEKAAKDDRRALSVMVEQLVEDVLRQKGYLK